MTHQALRDSLTSFVTYAQSLKGDEKGEAPGFLDHLFRALGHQGTVEAGATHEHRVDKSPRSKGKKFADLLWPQRVLIEMKSRGQKLERHYDQVFDYWTHIVPHRPPYVILCNFDEFWIYDFNQQLFDPVDKIPLADLPQRSAALGFLLPAAQKPLFENNRVEVTRKSAAKLAQLFRSLTARGVERERAQRFVLQLLVGLVSEDMELLPGHILTRLIKECRDQKASTYDLIGGLFRQMNDLKPAGGGRFTGVPYFNGGLFAVIDPVELTHTENYILADAADEKWDMVKPEIFGTLFQASMDDGAESGRDERHAFGAHFTSEFDIQKVVGPTIVRPWRERMEKAWNKVKELKEVLRDLRLFRVLDPACGSGNFLYVAYRELKRLEREILLRLSEISKGEPLESAVSIHQFYGLDIMPFAVELAKVTLMLAKEQEVREAAKLADAGGLLVLEKPLPLDNLDSNILCADALFTEWPKADAIIGNPPYLDARKITLEHGDAYKNKLAQAFPGIPGRADFCVYWFRKAHDQLEQDNRAGLVGTNTIRQNYAREGGLDYIVGNGGTITEAVATEVWSGDAQVHVSIVNWIKGEAPGAKKLFLQRGDSVESPWETYDLEHINSALSPEVSVASAVRLKTNSEGAFVFEGQQPGHNGFRLDANEAAELRNKGCADVIFPYLNGDELLGATYIKKPRFIIDFGNRDSFEARAFKDAFEIVKSRVLPAWELNAAAEKEKTGHDRGEHQNRLKTWWQLKRKRSAMITAIGRIPRYVSCSRIMKRPVFEFLSSTIHPDSRLVVFAFPDDYAFGILQSLVHWQWALARGATFKADPNYTSDTVFDTFPWPQNPTRKQIEAVAEAAVALRALRREIMAKLDYSLRDLYRTLEEPGANPLRDAHTKLDTAVRAAYGMPKDADILAFLLALNHDLAAKEKSGQKITPPGLPLPPTEHAAFITEDCITGDSGH